DIPSFQKKVHQLKDELRLGRSGLLKYGTRDEPSFSKTDRRSMDDKLGIEGTLQSMEQRT
ncbi:hypothetical protein HAX54_013384, partial [Datura stramonium]|nr:hypothetical protein [Datura stramonium]